MSSASAEDIFCIKRGVGNAKCEVVVSPSAMIKRRVAAANALRTLAVIPHPLGPSTRTAQKYGKGKFSGESPQPMRYERWRSSHILWASRPELLRNMVKGNLAASRRRQCVTNAGLIANILRAPSTSSAQKYGKGEYSQTTCHPDQASARGGIYAPI